VFAVTGGRMLNNSGNSTSRFQHLHTILSFYINVSCSPSSQIILLRCILLLS